MPKSGIYKLYVSEVLSDTSAGMTFSTPQYYKNVQKLEIDPKYNVDSAYGENRMIDQDTDFANADIAISKYSLLNSERNFLYGQNKSSIGGSIGSSGDQPPMVALLYTCPIRGDDHITYKRYGVIYKTMFIPQKDAYDTREGKPDLSKSDDAKGTAQPTEWSYKDAKGVEKHPWEYHIDSNDPDFPEEMTDEEWFGSVHVPSISAISALALSSSTPTSNATNIALDTKPTLTFNNVISNYKGIALLNTTDNLVTDVTLSIDSSGKIVTVTPSANLTANKTYNLVISGITDIYGQLLSTQIVKFTTVTA